MTPEISPEADIEAVLDDVDSETFRTSEQQRWYLERWARGLAGTDLSLDFTTEEGKTARINYEPDPPQVTIPAWEIPQPVTDLDRPTYDNLMQHMLTLHEVGHLLYTDEEAGAAAEETVSSEYQSQFRRFFNALEDGAVEEQLKQDFPVTTELGVMNANYLSQPEGEMGMMDAILGSCIDLGVYDTGTLRRLADPDDEHLEFATEADKEIFQSDIFETIVETVRAVRTETDPVERVQAAREGWAEIEPHLDNAEDPSGEQITVNDSHPAPADGGGVARDQIDQLSDDEIENRMEEMIESIEGLAQSGDETADTEQSDDISSLGETASDQNERSDADTDGLSQSLGGDSSHTDSRGQAESDNGPEEGSSNTTERDTEGNESDQPGQIQAEADQSTVDSDGAAADSSTNESSDKETDQLEPGRPSATGDGKGDDGQNDAVSPDGVDAEARETANGEEADQSSQTVSPEMESSSTSIDRSDAPEQADSQMQGTDRVDETVGTEQNEGEESGEEDSTVEPTSEVGRTQEGEPTSDAPEAQPAVGGSHAEREEGHSVKDESEDQGTNQSVDEAVDTVDQVSHNETEDTERSENNGTVAQGGTERRDQEQNGNHIAGSERVQNDEQTETDQEHSHGDEDREESTDTDQGRQHSGSEAVGEPSVADETSSSNHSESATSKDNIGGNHTTTDTDETEEGQAIGDREGTTQNEIGAEGGDTGVEQSSASRETTTGEARRPGDAPDQESDGDQSANRDGGGEIDLPEDDEQERHQETQTGQDSGSESAAEDVWTADIDEEPSLDEVSVDEYRAKAQDRLDEHREIRDREAEELAALQETIDEIDDLRVRELSVVDGPVRGSYRSDESTDIRNESRRLSRILERKLQKEQRSEYRHGRRQGEIDTRVVHRLNYDDYRVFRQETSPDEKDYDAVFVLDRSGSMSTDIKAAERATATLSMALEDIDIDSCVIDMYSNEPRVAKPFSVEVESKLDSILTGDCSGGTPLSPCLRLARQHLEKRDSYPFMTVVTDGRPSNEEAYKNELKRTNFPVLGVYLDFTATSPTDIPSAIQDSGNLFDRRKIITDEGDLLSGLRRLCQGVMF